MLSYDVKTNRGWPLPHPRNTPLDDVQRISAALTAVDNAVTNIESLIETNSQADSILDERLGNIEARQAAQVRASTDADADYAAEVVDARVDAEGSEHANIGEHIRHWLSWLRGRLESIESSLRAQIDDLAEAGVSTVLDTHAAFERVSERDRATQARIDALSDEARRNNDEDLRLRGHVDCLQNASEFEARKREIDTTGLQEQVNNLSNAVLCVILEVRAIYERLKKELLYEQRKRDEGDIWLGEQTKDLSIAALRTIVKQGNDVLNEASQS